VAVSVTQVQPDGNTAYGFGSAFLPFCGATTHTVDVRVTTFDIPAFVLGKDHAEAVLFSTFFPVATDAREISIRLR
jgi:hypothetical protein